MLLPCQVEHLRQQKEQAEMRLRSLEQEQQEDKREAVQRETRLNQEISAMRNEMQHQNQIMRDNHNLVLSLQQQLARVQSHAHTPRSARTAESSRVCSLQ